MLDVFSKDICHRFSPTIAYYATKYASRFPYFSRKRAEKVDIPYFAKRSLEDIKSYLVQEGYMLLINKVSKKYDFGNVKFVTYLSRCLENHFKNLLKAAYVRSLDIACEPDLISTLETSPERIVAQEEFLTKVYLELNRVEKLVFMELAFGPNGSKRSKGVVKSKVSNRLNIHPKVVERSCDRIREVIKEIMTEV